MSKDERSVLDLFLEDFGIKDGKIKIGDEIKVFKEMPIEVQKNILTNLVNVKKGDSLELSEDEKKTIALLREKKTSFDEFVNSIVDEEVNKVKNHYETQSNNYKELPDDAIYMKHLKEKNKDASDDELQRKLNIAKESSDYDKIVEDLRDIFTTAEEVKIAKLKKENEEKENELTEKEKEYIVNEVYPLEYIDDWKLTDEKKEELLSKIIEFEETEDGVKESKFISEIKSSPEKLMKAAYEYYNSEDNYKQLSSFYKLEIEKAKKEALEDTNIDTERTGFEAVVNKIKDDDEPAGKENVSSFGEE